MSDARGKLVRRALREHRAWIWPVVVLVAANIAALVLGVLPLSRTVDGSERRAAEASADAQAAAAELAAATSARDGRDTATRELDIFYADVLPASVGQARRLLQLNVAQLARKHDVTFARAVAAPETIRGSSLARLRASVDLVGRYRDVRQFLYDLETSSDFVIVDSIVLSEGDDASSLLNLTLGVSTYFKAAPDVR
ncbi:MAG: GspMb/PilO family protein [Vicinamibacterales bacterium]